MEFVIFAMYNVTLCSSVHLFVVSVCINIITTTTTIVLRSFVWDYPGEPVPEETLTHPPS